jgi:signal transduction histidine kinase
MTEFLIAVAVVVAAIVFTERFAWRQISRLRSDLGPELVGRTRSADRLRSQIVQVDAAWKMCLESGQPTDRVRFEEADKGLREILTKETTNAPSDEEKVVLEKLAVDYRGYWEMARSCLAEQKSDSNAQASTWRVGASLSKLLADCEQLGVLNADQARKLASDAGESLTRLQRFLFISLLGLLVCGAGILTITYRRMVSPLQNRLAESRTLMDRQEKLASLGVLATGIAHEIRNPITAIKVRLFTLKDSHQPGSSESEDLEVIESEINRLERIVQEFLRFARPTEPDLITMPVDPFLREVYELLLPELKKRGLKFELDLNAPESARIDPEKMKQVLLNFIHNAADSIEGTGTVTLASRSADRAVDGRPLPAIVIEVADTGKGMSPEVQKRLFDPFFTTKEKGTGLGLPIAARIVEKHGGLIQYHTEEEKGTTFTILLPRANS